MQLLLGVMSAPAAFQKAMDIILSRVKWKVALVYKDDVIIFSRSNREQLTHVKLFLRLLQHASVTLKLKNCSFFQPSADCVVHVVLLGERRVAKTTTTAIRKAGPPRTYMELRSFLGLCTVYHRFVPGFAKIADPLNEMLKKGTPSKFDDRTDEQYETY